MSENHLQKDEGKYKCFTENSLLRRIILAHFMRLGKQDYSDSSSYFLKIVNY